MEASRLASVGERLTRLEEASRKREETNAAFIAATQTALEDKLDTTSSNREAYLNGLRAKISDHVSFEQDCFFFFVALFRIFICEFGAYMVCCACVYLWREGGTLRDFCLMVKFLSRQVTRPETNSPKQNGISNYDHIPSSGSDESRIPIL